MRQTSLAAFNQIKADGTLSAVRFAAYQALFKYGPMTGAELDNSLKSQGGRGHYHKRLPELRDMDVVAEVGRRKCRVTGHNAITWDVTPHLPKDMPSQVARPSAKIMSKALVQLRSVLRYWVNKGGNPNDVHELIAVGKWMSAKFGDGS